MKRKMLCLGLTLVLALAMASAAWAQAAGIRPLTNPIGTLGPINPVNGFPLWVGDRNGVRLDMATPPVGDPVIPDNPFSVQIGFGAEAFFYTADARIDLPNGGRALLVLAIEAAFGAEAPTNGDQFLFARVRVRIDTPVAGDYTVITPWGTYAFPNTPAGTRAINFTFDFGGFGPVCPNEPSCFAAGVSESPGFERILVAPTDWSFLTQLNPAPPPGLIGDGATEATVTPGPTGIDSFTVQGPANAFGAGVSSVTTNLFIVSGHIFVEGGAQ